MSIAWLSGLIILVILVIMLIAGAPIAISLAVSSICAILPVLSTCTCNRGTENILRYIII